MKVTVFGGARTIPGDSLYAEAYELGSLLAKAGHSVLTGGYIGTMEAVSRGAAEAGGHVIGITCDEIERWRTVRPNPWVMEEQRFSTLNERLVALVDQGDAYIALNGGAGTLAEISITWNRLIINSLPPRPLILLGEAWKQVIQGLFDLQSSYISAPDRVWVKFASTPQEAVQQIQNHQESNQPWQMKN